MRVSFPKIGDYERKEGIFVPRSRQGFPGGKGVGRTVFWKKDDKPRDPWSFKETHEVRECEDVPENSEGENEDDEQDEVY